jgi:ketosteroid isomerase-like protein
MTPDAPRATIERLVAATNAHDLERLVACFAADYRLEAPTHPGRSFSGTAQVRRNWAGIFAAVPDLVTRLVSAAVDGEVVWTELEMIGTRRDGVRHWMCGVFVFVVVAGQIRSGRMFLEPVEEAGGTMDAAVHALVGGPS